MIICPFDMGFCQRRECATGVCKFAADTPLTPCQGCGEPVERAAAAGRCTDCVAGTFDDPTQGR